MANPTNAHTNYLIILLKSGVAALPLGIASTEDAYYTDACLRVKQKSKIIETFSPLEIFKKTFQDLDLKRVISSLLELF